MMRVRKYVIHQNKIKKILAETENWLKPKFKTHWAETKVKRKCWTFINSYIYNIIVCINRLIIVDIDCCVSNDKVSVFVTLLLKYHHKLYT